MEMENNSIKTIVYITINTINNKIYIGTHVTEDPYKFDSYWGCGITGTSCYWFKHPKYPFQLACKKYGLDAFRRYTLYVFDSMEEALAKEKEIVNEQFLKRPDVYNVALGGGSGLVLSTEIEVHKYDLEGKYLESYRSYSDAGRKNNISYMSIISAVTSKGICCNSYWSLMKRARLDVTNYKKSNKVPVYLYKANGEYLRDFESISDCAKYLEINISGVQKSIKYKTKCVNHYVTTEKIDKFIVPKRSILRNVPIYQYAKDGTFVAEFTSFKEVRAKLNKTLTRLSCHIQDRTIYEGYYWSYDKVDKFEVPKPKTKQIGQYTLDGELVKVWNTYRECASEFSNLRYVLNGSRASTKGYYFKYLS